ncbi:isochorismatase family protein [Mycolicibacterium hassiacum DSM 44199]|uniref:Isochorismatase family protein n=1 Tax=Mycolicibacterium hassiacum (strain DSM 44199 / CIP 105218 / JCM 12690 / 3849) TaxID=1122247 RepID=K5BDZ8_MYCHD|nr:isochorismatase family protein [Mycolicibacterium hassiacum DSM 44199]MBX5485525.1 cysteine hydrolase [Mycolicibacterium hassiacum]MDA4088759.1 cysteine hydrolase [Mycolicibacterium hassiacum DSM 44199]PZN20690.1 MAG: cysteine hydrolase [Mycolicibacterium hassiacum]VCT91489.1 Maleamate amidohydrolase [Mycolicibacterium hassiacum DSM 44199]
MVHGGPETTVVSGPDYTTPNWAASALVVVDLQRDFLDGGAAAVPGTSAVVPRVAALTAAFRAAGRPIAHIVRLYRPGGSDVDLPRRRHIEQGGRVVAPGSDGAQIPAEVLPAPVSLDSERLLAGREQTVGAREVVLFKPRWSAFHRTRLEDWLRDQGCDTVVVAGCNLPNCPRATLFDASERDFRAVLVVDAVSQTSPERLADLERIGVRLADTGTVRRALSVPAR